MNKKNLEILVTNDDGFESKGFKTVISLLSKYGNITAIAPKAAQSGKSAALTMGEALWLRQVESKTAGNGNKIDIYYFTGTPVDCVKMAMNSVFSLEKKPDILVSGINHGSNASAAAVYSGTLGAAQEGTLYSIPSIALSIDTHEEDADFSVVRKYLGTIMKNFLACPPSRGVYLNVNFPAVKAEKIKGIRFAEQGDGMWIDEMNSYTTPYGSTFYMMSGTFVNQDVNGAGDHTYMEKGYITIVPHQINTTSYTEKERLAAAWDLK